jgi:flagellar hook-length control protein FliK
MKDLMALKILPALPAMPGKGKVTGKLPADKGEDLAALFASALAGAVLPHVDLLAGKVVLRSQSLSKGQHDSGTSSAAAAALPKPKAPAEASAHSNVTPSASKSDLATDSAKDPPPKIQSPPTKAAAPPRTESPPQAPPQQQQQNAGQTIDFSGHLLDAKPAKDIPAPQPAPQNDVQDLLARMIARAVNADRQRQAAVPGSIQPRTTTSGTTSGVSNAVTAAFQHAIVTAASAAEQQQQQQSAHQQGKAPDQGQQQNSQQTPATTQAAGPVTAQTQSTVQTAVTQPAATAYSSIDPHAIVEQIVKSIVVNTGGSQTQVRLRLKPEHLGDVSLKLTVDGNTISANLVAQNADVRDVLLANAQQLARSLAGAGLALSTFSVDVSGGNAGFTDQRSQQQHAPLKAAGLGSMLAGEDDSIWMGEIAVQPASAGPQALVLNHLV